MGEGLLIRAWGPQSSHMEKPSPSITDGSAIATKVEPLLLTRVELHTNGWSLEFGSNSPSRPPSSGRGCQQSASPVEMDSCKQTQLI